MYAALDEFGQIHSYCVAVTGSTTRSGNYGVNFSEDITSRFGFGVKVPWRKALKVFDFKKIPPLLLLLLLLQTHLCRALLICRTVYSSVFDNSVKHCPLAAKTAGKHCVSMSVLVCVCL